MQIFKYAQIQDGAVISLSDLSGQVEAPHMVAIDMTGQHNGRQVKLGDVWDGAAFSDAPPVEPQQ